MADISVNSLKTIQTGKISNLHHEPNISKNCMNFLEQYILGQQPIPYVSLHEST